MNLDKRLVESDLKFKGKEMKDHLDKAKKKLIDKYGSLDDVDEIENWFKRQEQTRVDMMSALTGAHLYDHDNVLLTNEVLFPREAAWNKDKTMGDVMVAFDIEFDELIRKPE